MPSVRWQKLHSFANFGLCFGMWDLQMCAMCVGFPNCPEGQKRVGKTKSSSKRSFFFIVLVFSQFLVLFFQFNLAGNGWVYEKLGISERFTVKLQKVKCELNTSNIVLSAQFFIYRVTNWAFLSVNGLR